MKNIIIFFIAWIIFSQNSFGQKESKNYDVLEMKNINKITVSNDLFPTDSIVYNLNCSNDIMSKITFKNGKVSSEEKLNINDSIRIESRKVYSEKSNFIELELIRFTTFHNLVKLKEEYIMYQRDTINSLSFFDPFGNIELTIKYQNNIPVDLKLFSNIYENTSKYKQINSLPRLYKNEMEIHKVAAMNSIKCKIDSSNVTEYYTKGDTSFIIQKSKSKIIENWKLINNDFKQEDTNVIYGTIKLNENEKQFSDSIINISTTYQLDSLENWIRQESLTYIETLNFTKQFRNEDDYDCCDINNSTFKYKYDNNNNWIERQKYSASGELGYKTFRLIEYCK